MDVSAATTVGTGRIGDGPSAGNFICTEEVFKKNKNEKFPVITPGRNCSPSPLMCYYITCAETS